MSFRDRATRFGGLWTVSFCVAALALTGCLAYGFLVEQPHRQSIWTLAGLRHLKWLLLGYGLFATACYRFAPRLFVPVGAGLAVFLAVTSFGFGPLAATAFYAGSALALGDGLLTLLGARRETMAVLARASIAFLAGMCVIVLVIGAAVHFPVNYQPIYVAVLSVPLVLNWKALPYYGRELVRGWPSLSRPPAAFAACALLGFLLLIPFLASLNPEVGHDALALHLMVPAHVEVHHLWTFDVRNFIWALIPMAADWSFTGAYLLGGEYTARLTNLAFLLAIVALLYWFARRWLRRPAALLAVSLFASTPLVQLVTGSLFVENMQTALLLAAAAALERLRRRGEPALAVAAGLLLGTAAATKLGSLGFIVPLALVAAIRPRFPHRAKLPLWAKAAAAGVFALAALPPYAFAFWRTGNPFYPFLSGAFPSPGLPNIVFANPFHPSFHLPTVLYSLTFRSHEYMEGHDGSLGFHYLLLVPLSLLLVGRRWMLRAGLAAAAAVVGSLSILYLQPNLRYLYPSLPFWSILTFLTLGVVALRARLVSRLLLAACAGLALVNVWFIPGSGWWHGELYQWSLEGRVLYEGYRDGLAPVRKLVAYLNVRHPGEAVWFISRPQIAELQGRVYLSNWYQPQFHDEIARCTRAEELAGLLARRGIAHVVAPRDLAETNEISEATKSLLRQLTEVEFENGPCVLLRLKENAAPE